MPGCPGCTITLDTLAYDGSQERRNPSELRCCRESSDSYLHDPGCMLRLMPRAGGGYCGIALRFSRLLPKRPARELLAARDTWSAASASSRSESSAPCTNVILAHRAGERFTQGR